jgi:hypothetical protein
MRHNDFSARVASATLAASAPRKAVKPSVEPWLCPTYESRAAPLHASTCLATGGRVISTRLCVFSTENTEGNVQGVWCTNDFTTHGYTCATVAGRSCALISSQVHSQKRTSLALRLTWSSGARPRELASQTSHPRRKR